MGVVCPAELHECNFEQEHDELGSPQVPDDDLERAPDDAVVLRGGDLTGESSRKNLRAVYEEYHLWGLCATAGSGPAENLAHQVRTGSRLLMPGLISDLRKEGFDVIREPGHEWPDALITFQGEPDSGDWARLTTVMRAQSQIANPKHKGR